ncbi:MAG: CGNR zinc finger domain-containing protein [Acidimicrobiales bacterium]
MTGQVDLDSHSVVGLRVAVALVNALTPGQRGGHGQFAVPAGAARKSAVAEALSKGGDPRAVPGDSETDAFVALAATLRRCITALDSSDVDAAALGLNRLLAGSGAAPRLDRHDATAWHLHFHGRQADLATGWAAGCATAMAVAVGGGMADRIGICHADGCDRVFFDESRNASRRYCSLACQNRTKATAYRARRPCSRAQ